MYLQRQSGRRETETSWNIAFGTKTFVRCTAFRDKPATYKTDIQEDHKQDWERRIDSDSRSVQTTGRQHRISAMVDMEGADRRDLLGLNFIELGDLKTSFCTLYIASFSLSLSSRAYFCTPEGSSRWDVFHSCDARTRGRASITYVCM